MKNQEEPTWEEWVKTNISRGCDNKEIEKILVANGFRIEEAHSLTKTYSQKSTDIEPLTAAPPQTQLHKKVGELFLPHAQRIDSTKAEIYRINGFLSVLECTQLVALIRNNSSRSTTTEDGVSNFRTSQTCDLTAIGHPLIDEIDKRICRYMGIDPGSSEPIQGQWYDVGQQFKEHTDYFEVGSKTYAHHVGNLGQRSWTFMIYLNTTRAGGATRFPSLGERFQPSAGTAILWNNYAENGELNPETLHVGEPVEQGYKAVVTKWFRNNGPRTNYIKQANEYLPPLTTRGFLQTKLPKQLHKNLFDYYRHKKALAAIEAIPNSVQHTKNMPPTKIIELPETLRKEVFTTLQPLLEAWAGDYLIPTFVHGIREYQRGSTLDICRDDLDSNVVSVVLNIDQNIESQWPLYIEDHYYKPHKLFLKPGEMMFYEGGRLAHGRPDPLLGDSYANVFVHFKRYDDVGYS